MDDKQEKNFFIVDSSAYLRPQIDVKAGELRTNVGLLLGVSRMWSTNHSETQTGAIEAAFQEYTEDRKDIAILLINQHVSARARLELTPDR